MFVLITLIAILAFLWIGRLLTSPVEPSTPRLRVIEGGKPQHRRAESDYL